jgi:hypothetical protein
MGGVSRLGFPGRNNQGLDSSGHHPQNISGNVAKNRII